MDKKDIEIIKLEARLTKLKTKIIEAKNAALNMKLMNKPSKYFEFIPALKL